ncbi:hypothetical protein HMJ29_12415 [Hymenobacter taeanensis]|uniref:Uncharacterized protein n=1 Tax=Hymenobacter taeanensis TaxID=2735321 RepID=A0A6M6BGR2_9BACT|nr:MULTISPECIES: hypothetical protein [Hymenobacter]QJX47701.1 hypothetical protein HMJ29_12415 [Hymenobacter taeanensis]UOQ82814.1 hypothetical protein MUN83_08655 [Hymenobacter sp. 5414T-23]
MSEFISYQRFPSLEVAQPLLDILRQRGIEFETGFDRPRFDVTFAFNPTSTYFVVKLRQEDFEAARLAEEQTNETLTASVPIDHYLYSFTDGELLEILAKPDEWNNLDVTLARQLLRQRGHDVSPDVVQLLRQRRLVELAKPEESQKTWILAGYLMAILGGIVAVFIGWHLFKHQKQLPTGEKVLAFAPTDRQHGLRIFILGVLGTIFWTGLRIYTY